MEGPNFIDETSKKPNELSAKDKESLLLSKLVKGDGFARYIYFKGKRIGRISLRESHGENLRSVYEMEIKPEYRNKGIGKEIYRRINQELNKQGLVLASESGGITSADGKYMWESLVRSGEAEVIIDELTARGVPTRYKFKESK